LPAILGKGRLSLDSLSPEKAARFVCMRDALGIPLLVIVDVPGYVPGWTRNGKASSAGGTTSRLPRILAAANSVLSQAAWFVEGVMGF
jgi:Carboxyl transferase domain